MLELKNVKAGYGFIPVLQNISLQVGQNEIVTLIGANGAGKTSTLKTIMGILKPSQGEIFFQGEVIHRFPSHKIVKRGIAICPEGRRIFANLTVQENLNLGSLHTKAEKARDIREHIYHLFPVLKEREKQLAGTLSGGEQQMLAIGRALMAAPQLLLLDEPSLGLSPLLVERIFETLVKINQEGIPILLVEQNAHLALSISHRAYVMETGKIVMAGESSQLLHDEKVKSAYLGGL